MTDSNKRLKSAREATCKDPHAVAAHCGLQLETYYDIEAHGSDIRMSISLKELFEICAFLHSDPRNLFSDEILGPKTIGFDDLLERAKSYIGKAEMSLPQFEAIIGWEVSDFFDNTKNGLRWNVDCLCAICSEVGIDWLEILAPDRHCL